MARLCLRKIQSLCPGHRPVLLAHEAPGTEPRPGTRRSAPPRTLLLGELRETQASTGAGPASRKLHMGRPGTKMPIGPRVAANPDLPESKLDVFLHLPGSLLFCLCTSRPKQKHKGRKSIQNSSSSSFHFCSSPGCPRFRLSSDNYLPFWGLGNPEPGVGAARRKLRPGDGTRGVPVTLRATGTPAPCARRESEKWIFIIVIILSLTLSTLS